MYKLFLEMLLFQIENVVWIVINGFHLKLGMLRESSSMVFI